MYVGIEWDQNGIGKDTDKKTLGNESKSLKKILEF